ncbi:hypothetical protein [Mucilaginibacter lacusdianchii]|uniref:hypothetical protein n=1 Tax=Mucilaginibacter lacusdianchii TaxID=2684211 RepID=UPI00131B2AD5|nr:hypothetical protein [Mucilaginibacter sp. JXJ CY 39]
MNDYVWYVSYGSNLLKERFLIYINGGKFPGSTAVYLGCKNKSLPKDCQDIYINSELYFARTSKSWNGAVAFIRTQFSAKEITLGRMYLITKEQFIDIVKQENSIKNDLDIDFNNVINKQSSIISNGFYGNILFIGNQDNYPMFTFTNKEDIQEPKRPTKEYLSAIIRGIKQTFGYNNEIIFDYLTSKKGIKDNYRKEELLNIIKEHN